MHQERVYQHWIHARDLTVTRIRRDESDLLILARDDVTGPASQYLEEARKDLESYIRRDEKFLTARKPHEPLHDAPRIAVRMAEAGMAYGVGPMAAVAGAVAECVGEQIALVSDTVAVENGGDIYLHGPRSFLLTLYAGENSPYTGRLRFRVGGGENRLGVCTSSGTVGHSYSAGRADAVCVVAQDATRADAAATSFANRIREESDISAILARAESDADVEGVLVAMGKRLGVWGAIQFVDQTQARGEA